MYHVTCPMLWGARMTVPQFGIIAMCFFFSSCRYKLFLHSLLCWELLLVGASSGRELRKVQILL